LDRTRNNKKEKANPPKKDVNANPNIEDIEIVICCDI
jgi:hypothetical protein